MLELLESGVSFEKIEIVEGLEKDAQTKDILNAAKSLGVEIVEQSIGKMAKRRSGSTREVIVGHVSMPNTWTLNGLLDSLYEKDETPFFVLVNRANFDSNIGVIARTAFAAGVNGLFFQGDERDFLNEDTLHYSLGTIARVPIVKMSMFEALKELKKNGIPTYCVDMAGERYTDTDMTGPAAFVLGAERKGVSDGVADRCSQKISIPMKEGIDSLNVSVSAGIVLYEKNRKEGLE